MIGAGLIPALRRCALPGSDRWGIITGRPGDRPFENIASSGLEGAGLGLAGAAKEWLSKNPDRTRMVLVLDQFEELFATASPEKRRDFLEQLRELLEADLPLTLLLVMRDDFFSRLAQEAPPSLFEWVRGFVHISSGLEEAELEEIVRGPAGKVGLQFEEGLSEVVIKDVLESSAGGERAGRSTILPLLEFTLTELWMRRRDGYLTHDAYAAIGGVTGSLTQWADKAYQGLVGEGLGDAARRVLTGLVNPGDQRHSIPDSRRRRPIQDICVDDRQKESINIAVKFLADARLIATSFDQQSRVETVEIIHDSLIREWGKLRQWLNEDRNFLAWQKEMDKRVEAWEETSTDKEKRESGRLLRGLDLSEAENWMKERGRDLSAGKREFIQTSIELREKEIKRIRKEKNRRNIIIFFALFSLMALFLASITFNEKIRADEKTQDATALYLASQSEIGRASSGDSLLKSILLAVESLRHRNTSAGMIALQKGLDLLAKPIPQLSSSNYSYAVAFSPDNTKFATAERDGFAKIWDINNARLVHILNHHGEVTAIAFSHDGDKIVTGSGDNTAVVWSAETGEMLHQLNHTYPVWAVEFDPFDSRIVATASSDLITFWDSTKEMKIDQWNLNDIIYSIDYNQDGSLIAAGCGNDAIIFHTGNGSVFKIFNFTERVNAVRFDSSGDKLAAGSYDKTFKIWDTGTWNELASMNKDALISSVAFTPDGDRLAIGGKGVMLWDYEERSEILRPIYSGGVLSIDISNDGKLIAISGTNGTDIWDIRTGIELLKLDHNDVVMSVAFSRLGNKIATGSKDYTVRVWDVDSGIQIWSRKFDFWITSVAFSPDGSKLACSGKEVRLLDSATGRELWIKDYNAGVWAVCFSSNGQMLATASTDRKARILNVASGRELWNKTHNDTVMTIAFSSDGSKLATGSNDNTFRLWNVTTSKEIWNQSVGSAVDAIAFSPNGKMIATGSEDSTARIWDISTGAELQRLEHGGSVYALAFSPDGSKLATGSTDNLARLWDVYKGLELTRIKHNGFVEAVAFSPDGSKLATGSDDGAAHIWNLNSNYNIKEACKRLTKNMTIEEWSRFFEDPNSECLTCPSEGSFNQSFGLFERIKINMNKALSWRSPASAAIPGKCQPCISENVINKR
ncbi:MAG TPA: WD40 repeat domain-containing protein [Methanothrix sp.]|nr:WD40 repeat domain-containing protein [Methanothrix sp.]